MPGFILSCRDSSIPRKIFSMRERPFLKCFGFKIPFIKLKISKEEHIYKVLLNMLAKSDKLFLDHTYVMDVYEGRYCSEDCCSVARETLMHGEESYWGSLCVYRLHCQHSYFGHYIYSIIATRQNINEVPSKCACLGTNKNKQTSWFTLALVDN